MTLRDPTPFQTRTTLLSLYETEVNAVRSGMDPYPVAIEINPAGFCNQGCHWCISENAHQHRSLLNFDNEKLEIFFVDFASVGGCAVGWSGGGEPTCHPQFAKGLELVGKAGLAQGLITHGAFGMELLDPIAAHCDWVRISIDTPDSKEYARKRNVRPATFDAVIENTKQLVARKVRVGLNMNVASWNLSHIEALYALAAELGVAYLQVRPTLATPYPHSMAEDLLSPGSINAVLERLERIRSEAQSYGVQLVVSNDKFEDIEKPDYGRTYKGCLSHRLFLVLNWNGDLMVCMYHLADKRFSFGNVLSNSLIEIWRSNQRKEVVRFCREELNHSVHECQVCCKGHEINKVLFNLVDVAIPIERSGSPFL